LTPVLTMAEAQKVLTITTVKDSHEPDFIVDDIELFLQHHSKRLSISVQVTTSTARRQQVRRVVIQHGTTIHLIVVLHTTYISTQ